MNYEGARQKMLDSQIRARNVRDPRVLEAIRKVPRHLFVEEALRDRAYLDKALPIGEKQTISQPYMVAAMSEALELGGRERVLEIGTGSGYQTAVLAELAESVFSVERGSRALGEGGLAEPPPACARSCPARKRPRSTIPAGR